MPMLPTGLSGMDFPAETLFLGPVDLQDWGSKTEVLPDGPVLRDLGEGSHAPLTYALWTSKEIGPHGPAPSGEVAMPYQGPQEPQLGWQRSTARDCREQSSPCEVGPDSVQEGSSYWRPFLWTTQPPKALQYRPVMGVVALLTTDLPSGSFFHCPGE